MGYLIVAGSCLFLVLCFVIWVGGLFGALGAIFFGLFFMGYLIMGISDIVKEKREKNNNDKKQ